MVLQLTCSRSTNDLYSLESLLPPLSPSAEGSPAEKDSIRNFTALRQYFSIPLKLASAYRLIQGILSSPEFVRGDIDEARLGTAWSTLDAIWNGLKTPETSKLPQAEYSEYSRIWKLFTFECCRSRLFLISFIVVRDPHLQTTTSILSLIKRLRFRQKDPLNSPRLVPLRIPKAERF